jgi:hypothetical protein
MVCKSSFRRKRRAFVAVRINLREFVEITLTDFGGLVIEIAVFNRLVRQSFPEYKRQIFIDRTINVKA